ncbi:MAG: sodium/solute symporter [Planctomycetota bacterium]
MLDWTPLPAIPDELGVAGPVVGVHGGALIVAGGANFPQPVWERDKVWHDRIYALRNETWRDAGTLPRKLAYASVVSTKHGIVCIGGNDSESTFSDVWLLQYQGSAGRVVAKPYPSLPSPSVYSAAALIDDTIYVVGGQSGSSLETATNQLWSLDLSLRENPEAFTWRVHDDVPISPRAFHLAISQHDGYHDALYVISGRQMDGEQVRFLTDTWKFVPANESWTQCADIPVCVMAAPGIAFGQSHLFVLGGDDGTLFGRSEELKDDHPGFSKQSWAYHTITDTWTSAGETPANHVTTVAVEWKDRLIVASGEIRPRVRSPKVWSIEPIAKRIDFGWINYGVLIGYLFSMVGIGLFFAKRNKSTDDFFRGGKSVPWWAAGCSIFATMLSSLTYTGIPSKAFAQDWVLAVGNFMIPVVAVVAVYVALPFYRRIDATSAYEYLERRFNRAVRLFGSASFTLFHVFRMAVVMSLTGLALAIATPLTPTQSVVLMGALSILYCTMGGIEAVIWTDTVQTVVLIGGALVAIWLLVGGIDGGTEGFFQVASDADKWTMANWSWDPTNTQIAFWVIVVGGIAQNLSSYTADQAVVQRYVTTPTEKLAARSIWTNAVLTLPATLLFFGIGTALYAFYRSHPEKLDPTATTDQIFPMFIANEMPVGLAGLIVAGVFAAAQSTVSTSMNSTATTVVTDFLKPLNVLGNDRQYLLAARWITLTIGIAGTAIGLLFVDPDIKSLFDQFIKVIGLFMGVLGGLFVLGALTTRANGLGALVGAFAGAGVMYSVWKYTDIDGYLYTATGITTCFCVGYLVSRVVPSVGKNLDGLTIHTLDSGAQPR